VSETAVKKRVTGQALDLSWLDRAGHLYGISWSNIPQTGRTGCRDFPVSPQVFQFLAFR